MNPEHLLVSGGLAVLAAIVFAESGVLAGFFLPGDLLLFIAGFLTSSTGGHRLPALPLVVGVAFVAAVVGVVLVSVAPLAVETMRHRRQAAG